MQPQTTFPGGRWRLIQQHPAITYRWSLKTCMFVWVVWELHIRNRSLSYILFSLTLWVDLVIYPMYCFYQNSHLAFFLSLWIPCGYNLLILELTARTCGITFIYQLPANGWRFFRSSKWPTSFTEFPFWPYNGKDTDIAVEGSHQ